MSEFKLTDRSLFAYATQMVKKMDFLSQKSSEALEIISKKGEFTDDELIKLWRELLTDAIHTLKAFDKREKASGGGFEFNNPDARNKARLQNVHGIDSLFEFFHHYTEFERLLYGTEPHYRDHIAHPIRVWLTGIKLIGESGKIGSVVDFEVPNDVGVLTDPECWAMWTVIALCHDLGYPLEKAHKVVDQIDKMLSFFGNVSTGAYRYSFQTHHQSLIEFTLKTVTSKLKPVWVTVDEGKKELRFTTAVQPKYHAKFSHSFEEFKHGIISVLVLVKSLVYFMEMDFDPSGTGTLKEEDARQFHIRRQILRAIASHTCPEVYHLKINTPSFLLIVCDDLQEWGRRTSATIRKTQANEDPAVTVKECDLAKNRLSCMIEYEEGKPEDRVLEDFLRYHKLLRPAIDDAGRNVNFTWRVKNRGLRYDLVFSYDSQKAPFEEMTVTRNGSDYTTDLLEKLQIGSQK